MEVFPIINNAATSPQPSIILRQTFEPVSGPRTTLDLATPGRVKEGSGEAAGENSLLVVLCLTEADSHAVVNPPWYHPEKNGKEAPI